MQESGIINFNETGDTTGSLFSGNFKVKTLLSRRDLIQSDEKRRLLLGKNAENAAPAIQAECYMLAELSVRITEAPTWWTDSSSGLDLKDGNIVPLLFEACLQEEQKRKDDIKEKAKNALEKLAKG